MAKDSSPLVRFSVSIPQDVADGLDRMSNDRGFANRSQCLTSLVRDRLVLHASQSGNNVMMGIISLIHDHAKRDLQNKLTDLQHKYLKEIVTIQVVHLENHQSLQVILVQGPARTLRLIANEMISLPGVRHGQLQLNTEILPPLHEG
ncbi:MAG: nickel-responsive transcriptional regulator NikR [Verrucomicrobiales bacterium]|jgi:CopG family nickel-responsive transcriptional regulator|nr:nickel-responsive transcriptional regulator NikR [Verrucomicrobiales bacterium]MDB6130748.1 nickel-responsive transcriptional regulator NikR [Verrucomicrobiales bacterium]